MPREIHAIRGHHMQIDRLFHRFAFGTALLLLTNTTAHAAGPVTLQTEDGTMRLEGEIIGLDNGQYRLMTAIGEVHLRADMVTCEGDACPSDVTYVFGEPVVLQTADNTVKLTGILRDVDDGAFVLEVPGLGEVRLAVAETTCSGLGCPEAPVASAVQQVALTAPQADATPASSEAPASADQVLFAGSDVLGQTLMPALLEGYASFLGNGGGASAQFASFGDTEAFSQLASGTVDFVVSVGKASDADVARMAELGLGDLRGTENETVIGFDAAGLLVNAENPVRSIPIGDAARIYSGEVRDWSAFGGASSSITALYPQEGSDHDILLREGLFAQNTSATRAADAQVMDDAEMLNVLAQDRNAVAFSGDLITQNARAIGLVGACGIQSRATPFAIKAEEYPLGRRVYLYTNPSALSADARNFLQFVTSGAADAAIKASPFVDLAIERQAHTTDRKRDLFNELDAGAELSLALELRGELEKFDRLSTTIRFPSGSTDLGLKERSDIRRLASYLSDVSGTAQVAIVGFADSSGGFANNARLSAVRAETVAAALRQEGISGAGNIAVDVRGYGELAPLACNTDVSGRSINRRVEIWISSAS